jgi:two-component SAPR family response regulator
MVEQMLDARRILIVEDEYLLADDLASVLREAGAHVLGPVPSVAAALSLIANEDRIDGAVLDINLRGEMVFPLAAALQDRGIAFIFATGYDEEIVPERFAHLPRVEKPLNGSTAATMLGPLLSTADSIDPA